MTDHEVSLREPDSFPMVPVAQIRDRMTAIKQVSHEIMREHVHYGSVTGPEGKKSLWKSGAELLCMTFRIGWRFEVEDLSKKDETRYRVRCTGLSSAGEVLGDGMGECSSSEEKYKWRRAVVDQEWDATPEFQRRDKYNRGKGGSFYITKQVRTDPNDYGNTVLKMACKRAHVAMTLGVTGCSDEFTQDLDDEDRVQEVTDEAPPVEPQRRSESAPQKAAKAPKDGEKPDMTGEIKWIQQKVRDASHLGDLLTECGIKTLDELTPDLFIKIRASLTRVSP